MGVAIPKKVSSFKEMTNLGKELISKLEENFAFPNIKILKNKKVN